jgi:DNA-directed RNA polymerase specialized sigma24 family protein
MHISTITTADIIPEATRAIERYTKRRDPNVTMFKYDTHITVDDLIMDTVEKVVKANPTYLTKSYVWLAAKSVCINRTQKKKLDTVPMLPAFELEDGVSTPLEEEIPADTYDYLQDLAEYLTDSLDKESNELIKLLLTGKMYVEIAEDLGISLRTLERKVHELKWKMEYLLTEVDPTENPLVF